MQRAPLQGIVCLRVFLTRRSLERNNTGLRLRRDRWWSEERTHQRFSLTRSLSEATSSFLIGETGGTAKEARSYFVNAAADEASRALTTTLKGHIRGTPAERGTSETEGCARAGG